MQEGRISKILHGGSKGDGFISFGQNKSVYYRAAGIINQKQQPKEGQKLLFRLTETNYKGKKKLMADELIIL